MIKDNEWPTIILPHLITILMSLIMILTISGIVTIGSEAANTLESLHKKVEEQEAILEQLEVYIKKRHSGDNTDAVSK